MQMTMYYMCSKDGEYDCLRYLVSIGKNLNLNIKLNVTYIDDKNSNETVLNLCIENSERIVLMKMFHILIMN